MMKNQVYRMIVKATMTRMPGWEEQTEDFFIGFDGWKNPYLLLPTPEWVTGDTLFAVRLLPDPLNHFRFSLDGRFTKMSFSRFQTFFDDKTYFFGPKDNMLEQFFESDMYHVYTEWMQHLYMKQLEDENHRQIS